MRRWARDVVGVRYQHTEVAQPVHQVQGRAGAAVSGAMWLEQSQQARAGQ